MPSRRRTRDIQALIRTIEGSVRGFVATKKQAEILLLRGEIVADVKESLDHTLETWGFHLIDLQLNDITFDAEITTSMAKVVSFTYLKFRIAALKMWRMCSKKGMKSKFKLLKLTKRQVK